jgi:hypothetical protein
MEIRDADRLAVPFGFQQIGFTSKLEAAVDLFAPQSERLLGGQAKGVEQALEKFPRNQR